jgi:phospholipase/carboxylesterase
MTEFVTPLIIRWGSLDPEAPLIVLFVDCGAPGEAPGPEMATFARYLPGGAGYAAVRLPGSLDDPARTFAWFRGWLDAQRSAPVPVVLLGFGGGAAFAGGQLLADPARFAAATLLYGSLPFDAGCR